MPVVVLELVHRKWSRTGNLGTASRKPPMIDMKAAASLLRVNTGATREERWPRLVGLNKYSTCTIAGIAVGIVIFAMLRRRPWQRQ